MSQKRVLSEIKKNTSKHLSISLVDSSNSFYSQDLQKICINLFNNPLLYLTIPSVYPFKPPKINIFANPYKDYNRWCGDITTFVNNQFNITNSDILLAWFFTYVKWSNNISYRYIKQLYNFPLQCLCCTSLSCPSNWSPSIKLIDIGNEYILYRTFLIFISPISLKYIKTIFNNDNWNLPDDIIFKILEFI